MKQQLELTIRPSRQAIERVGGALHFLVRVEPPAAQAQPNRLPVALALVVDRSGSMAEPAAASITAAQPSAGGDDTGQPSKLGFVKAATQRLLDLMHDGDAVALVVFDDTIQVVKPLSVLSDRTRAELAAAIKAIETGGSTNIEGGLKAGLAQFSKGVRKQFGCKLVLLSDGEANVGEQRPAVLAERTAGAAHNGITTSTLGFGFDYNITLLSHLAEAGNGDFTHIESLKSLDAVLREEFTNAAEVTARAVEVAIKLPEIVAAGTNLNGYRQESLERGFKVLLGDLVRAKDFIFEVTTPITIAGVEITVTAQASWTDGAGSEVRVHAEAKVALCGPDEVEQFPADKDVVAKVLAQLPTMAEMETVVALEAGDVAAAGRSVQFARDSIVRARRMYGGAATKSQVEAGQAKLDALDAGANAGTFNARELKRRYGASRRASRGRPIDPDTDVK